MILKERIIELCNLSKKPLDAKYQIRLQKEIKELDEQNAFEYLLNLHERCSKENLKLESNQNNLLVSYLLDLTDEIDLDNPPKYIHGEYPDIDCDYLPFIQEYIKNDWAPKTFGEHNVCSISAYQTLGIKQSLQDVVRAYGLDRNEIVAITTSMEDKDDEGKPLTWDKALEIYPEFAAYCKNHPEVAADAKSFLNRNKARSKHAGGLIISSKRLDDFVPLELAKDGTAVSAWAEGLHTQDLQPVGLIKFDILVIMNNLQVAHACRLIKERHGFKNICSNPEINRDWSDVAYLNDPKALAMASEGDLRGIFQFDSEGIRSLVRRGGVTCFDDLVAFSALYRPGPMKSGLHEHFIKRKKKQEEYIIFPVLESVLRKTHGVMIYQEQVMKILNIVGEVPLKDCEAVRKAISKKKVDKFIKYYEMFIENGQRVLGISKEEVQVFWDQIVAFAEYGFNLCLSDDTIILDKKTSSYMTIKEAIDIIENSSITLDCFNPETGCLVEDEVDDIFLVGEEDLYEIELEDGFKFKCTLEHKFICDDNKSYPVREILEKEFKILSVDYTYMYEQHCNK